MIEKLKKNTKIKLIALFSAIILWMYVMAVVDPEDTKLYENIPITISADTMQQNPTQTTAVILSLVIHIANMSATPIMLTIIGNTFFSESNSIFFFNS